MGPKLWRGRVGEDFKKSFIRCCESSTGPCLASAKTLSMAAEASKRSDCSFLESSSLGFMTERTTITPIATESRYLIRPIKIDDRETFPLRFKGFLTNALETDLTVG
jgi:hypothetical protein